MPFTDYTTDFETISRALEFAKTSHGTQKRWDHTEYWKHLARVASRVSHHGYSSTESIVTSLLHDVCEDTPVTLDEVAAAFGDRVAFNVDLLSQRPGESREAYFNRCMTRGSAVVLGTKFADRVDNLATIASIPDDPEYINHVFNYMFEVENYFLPAQNNVDRGLRLELQEAYQGALIYFTEHQPERLVWRPVPADLTQRAS